MPESYQPVSCQLHSELELIIMHKQTIQLQLKSESGSRLETVIPYNIITRSGVGEFLLAEDRNRKKLEIRLDQIQHFKVLSSS